MKTKLPVPVNPKAVLAKRAEQAVLERIPVEPATLRKAVKYLDPKKMKLLAIAVAGGAALLSLLGTIGHDRIYRAAVARELKKQLAPVNERLDALQAQNEELKQQNEELKKQLTSAACS